MVRPYDVPGPVHHRVGHPDPLGDRGVDLEGGPRLAAEGPALGLVRGAADGRNVGEEGRVLIGRKDFTVSYVGNGLFLFYKVGGDVERED